MFICIIVQHAETREVLGIHVHVRSERNYKRILLRTMLKKALRNTAKTLLNTMLKILNS